MVHLNIIEARLSKLGVRPSRWSRPELIELQNILMDDEEVIALANGRYFAGFATIVATNIRLLIIDKRPFFLTVEDIRYDMISELDYSTRLLDATVHIFTVNKQHRFTSFKYRQQLRSLTTYVQKRVMELRQHQAQMALGYSAQSEPLVPQRPMPTVEPPVRTYRDMASRLSGRVLGPVAVKAAHSHYFPHLPNPYTRASLIVKHSGGWLSSHTPRPDLPQPAIQPES
jgi:hypothetical protein